MLALKEKIRTQVYKIFCCGDKFAFFLIVCAVLLSYINVIDGEFIYDDKNFIVDNKPIKTWLFARPWDFFLKPEVAVWSGIYRPLRTISFAVDYQIFGLNPALYRIENIIWHLANCALVYFLLKRIFINKTASFLSTLIFAVHPVQIEAVTWISSRGDLMFLFFVLICFHIFIKYQAGFSISRIIIWNLLFITALLSKETAISLLPSVFVYDCLFNYKKSETGFAGFIKKRLPFYITAVASAVVYLAVRFSLFENASQKSFWGGSAKTNFLTMLEATVYYFRLIFFPLGFSLDYSTYPITNSFADPFFVLALMFYCCTAGLVIINYRRKNHRFLFFVLFFVFFLLPSWNILPISAIIADRFLYAPMIGFCAILGWSFQKILNFPKLRKISMGGVCFIVSALIILSVYRNNDWRSDFAIWKSCVDVFPGNFKGHINLGASYDAQGKIIESITEYHKLISVAPHHATAYYNLGNLYWGLGLFDKSRNAYLTAIRLNPQYWEAYNNLGSLYVEKQWYDQAEQCFLKVVFNDANHMKAHFNLASLYINFFKDYDKASYHLNKLIKDDDFKNNPIVRNMLEEIKRQRYIKSLNHNVPEK